MGNFADAFGKGIEAHQSAERAVSEIVRVLNECAQEIERASGGTVHVQRSAPAGDTIGKYFTTVITLGAQTKLPALEPYTHLLASAVLPEGVSVSVRESQYILVQYDLAAAGYPVTLSYSDETTQCMDRESLAKALERMLSHPDTGGKLLRLMRLSQTHRTGKTEAEGAPPPTTKPTS